MIFINIFKVSTYLWLVPTHGHSHLWVPNASQELTRDLPLRISKNTKNFLSIERLVETQFGFLKAFHLASKISMLFLKFAIYFFGEKILSGVIPYLSFLTCILNLKAPSHPVLSPQHSEVWKKPLCSRKT